MVEGNREDLEEKESEKIFEDYEINLSEVEVKDEEIWFRKNGGVSKL